MPTFQIEHACPQCGAPAHLEEADRLFACPFCRVKSFLLTRDYFRYVLPAKNPSGKELYYVPYWRFKGSYFHHVGGNDHKICRCQPLRREYPWIPFDIGPARPGHETEVRRAGHGRPFHPAIHTLCRDLQGLSRRFSQGLSKPIICSAHIGVHGVLTPVLRPEKLYDAVLDQQIATVSDGFRMREVRGPNRIEGSFHGGPLPGLRLGPRRRTHALVLHCRNCKSAWYPSRERLTRSSPFAGKYLLRFALPFWLISCDIAEVTLKIMDLINLANLPRIAETSFEERSSVSGRPSKSEPRLFCAWPIA
jgi:DNA-directed RNA polymerase subunit RPC12/RpoP